MSYLNSSIIRSQWARINSIFDLSFIRIPRLAYKEPRHGKSLTHYVFGIFDRLFEKHFEVFIWGIVLVARILPLHDSLALPDRDVEEGVEEENHVVFHRVDIQEDWVRLFLVQLVHHKGRLDHNQGVGNVLSHQKLPIVFGFIGGGVESVQELRASQVKHKLGEETELSGELEGGGVILFILSEAGHQFNKESI